MFRKRIVEKALTELSHRTMVKPESVRSVACLIDLNILVDMDLDSYIKELFQIQKNSITAIYYAPKSSKDLTLYSPQFNNRHLHWDGTLLHPMKKKVLSKKYDLLFNFFSKDNLVLQSISSQIKAGFRVGYVTVDHRLNDLMLGAENNTADQFFGTFSTFFSKIKTDD
ncbi:MAG: hypothetical protein P8H63_02290 [Flavobacteriaceae bacterium]|nr:hypothetical protein [Flavobacteriaceae bacterium]